MEPAVGLIIACRHSGDISSEQAVRLLEGIKLLADRLEIPTCQYSIRCSIPIDDLQILEQTEPTAVDQ